MVWADKILVRQHNQTIYMKFVHKLFLFSHIYGWDRSTCIFDAVTVSMLVFLGSPVKIRSVKFPSGIAENILLLLFCPLWTNMTPTGSPHRRRASRWSPVACAWGECCLRQPKYCGRLKIKVVFVLGVQLWNIWPKAQWLPGTFTFIIRWYKVSRVLILPC